MNSEQTEATHADGRIELRMRDAMPPRTYRVAALDLVTNATIPALDAFAADRPAIWVDSEGYQPPEPAGRLVYDGPGWIENRWRPVTSRHSPAGYHLSIDGATYWVRGDGGMIVADTGGGSSSIALGSPLILALALRGIFGLHAGVVGHGGELVAFIGESGAGKSTLVRHLGEAVGPWRQVIDDTLPVGMDDEGRFIALPHLPQPKFAAALQPAALVPERMRLRAIYLLDEVGELSGGVAVVPLSQIEATVALVGHTVGGRLFGRDLLAAHLDFCAALSRAIPVRRLIYPRRFDGLPDVAARLAADLS